MNLRQNKLARLIVALLSEGITPHKIALTVALGVLFGVTPVLGTTTILCAVAAVVLRLNLPLIQAVNYLVYPLQILLLIPFIQVGQWIFRQPPLPFSFAQLNALFRNHSWHTLEILWNYTWHGLVAWLILGGSAAVIIYIVLRLISALVLAKRSAAQTPDVTRS